MQNGMGLEMKYDPIKEERKWREERVQGKRKSKSFLARRYFAHSCVRSKFLSTLVSLGCDNTSSVLDVGCGVGEDVIHVQKATKIVVGVDISHISLKGFKAGGFQGVLADAKKLPFHSASFDYVLCSALLHHLVGQGVLTGYLTEFVRVTKEQGYVIALEPNLFNLSGFLMNIFNTIKPESQG